MVNKSIPKKVKLAWVRQALIRAIELVEAGQSLHTCLVFSNIDYHKRIPTAYRSEPWYIQTTNDFREQPSSFRFHHSLFGSDFDDAEADNPSQSRRDQARLMWLAMLYTLIQDNVI